MLREKFLVCGEFADRSILEQAEEPKQIRFRAFLPKQISSRLSGPLGATGRLRRAEKLDTVAVNDLSAEDRHQGFGLADVVGRDGENVLR